MATIIIDYCPRCKKGELFCPDGYREIKSYPHLKIAKSKNKKCNECDYQKEVIK
jgi:hypothetical protein